MRQLYFKDTANTESYTYGHTLSLHDARPISITTLGGMTAAGGDTGKPLGRLHTHQATIESGALKVGDTVHLSVDAARRDRIRANHSATHLLPAAIRHRQIGRASLRVRVCQSDQTLVFAVSFNKKKHTPLTKTT